MEGTLVYCSTLAIGSLGAAIGYALRLPAGVLVGAMLAVAIANMSGKAPIATPPSEVRLFLQVGLGILLGSRFTAEIGTSLKSLWQPALVCAAIAIGTSLLSALLVSRWLGVEKLTALLGSAPGGLSDMSLIALDMGAQGPTVLIMHLVRLVCVISIVPWIVRLVVETQPGA